MLRISSTEGGSHTVTLRLEGRIAGPWVAELREACERRVAAAGSLKLDLAEVSFVDQEGVELLSELRLRGVLLVECSPFVEEQLKGPTARDA